MTSRFRSIVLIAGIIAGMLAPLRAADVCTVTGEILDKANGRKLADVTVILTNMRTEVPRGTRTDVDGKYFITAVYPPGQYKITVSLQGYATVELTNIWLAINDTKVVIPPLAMEAVTGPSTTLSVKGRQAVVSITDAATKRTTDEQTFSLLPLSGIRTFDELAFLAPGVAMVPQSAGTGPGVGFGVGTAGQFSVNGQRGRNNNFLVDMSDNNDQDVGVRRQGYISLIPQSIESIEQFQIITGTPQAEFGRNSGSIVNVISKTGGNVIHGSVYGYLTDSALSARNPFDQVDGPAPGESKYRRSQYGIAAGGPFVENRSFWFGSFERQKILDRPERHFAVATDDQRSYFGASPLEPSSTPGVSELEKYFADAGYYLPGVAGAAIWRLVPRANNPGGPYGPNTYTELMNGDGSGTIFSLKSDNKLTDRHSFTARYNFTDDHLTVPVTGGGIHSSVRPDTRTQNVSLFLNSVFSSNTTNQLRVSYGRTSLDFLEVAGSPLLFGSDNTAELSALFPNVPYLQDPLKTPIQAGFGKGTYGPYGTTGALGQMIIRPFSPLGVDVYNFAQARVNNTWQFADTLSRASGNHLFKFGFDIRRNQQNSRLDRNDRALAEFNSGFAVDIDGTRKVISGQDLASIGYATALFQTMIPDFNDDGKADFDSRIDLRFTEFNFFAQDDWRIAPRVTLSLGLRYEFNSTPESADGSLESTFADPLAGVPAQTFAAGDAANKAAYETMVASYEAFVGGREVMYASYKKNWAPRIGLAWDLTGDGKTALRAGYGFFYDQNISAVTSQSLNVFPHLIPLNASGFGSELFGLYLLSRQWLFLNIPSATIYPHEQVGTVNTIGVPSEYFGVFLGSQASQGKQGLAYTLPTAELKTPSAQQYHLTFERELIPETLFSVAYFGSRGAHLTRFRYPNGGIAGRPQFGVSPLVGPGGLSLLTAQTQPPASRVVAGLGPYSIFENSTPSSYNSFQVAASRRLSGGVEFTAAYTWAHSIDEVSDVFSNIGFFALPQSDDNLRAERASSNFDVRHRFAGSFSYDLPFARDNSLIGGWNLAGIFTAQTGQPYTVNTSLDINNDGMLTDRLNTMEGFREVNQGSTRLTGPVTEAAYAPDGQDGKVGRNTFRAPGLALFNLAIIKKFRFDEERNLEFRSEFFNLFNRTNYGVPVRILETPGFGRAVDTAVDSRRVQFALKFNF